MRGQALVIVALMLIVIFGFVGLAVDGGRLYWERRILQNAVDAAALAASDNYQDSTSLSLSLHAAATEFAANEKIYGTASANPSWTATTTDVSWTGTSDVMHVVFTSAGSVSAFDISSSHRIGLAFMQVLGFAPTTTVATVAEGHAKTGGTNGDALVTLSQQTCTGGSINSMRTQGASGSITVNGGNVVSNGSVVANGYGITVNGGNFSDNCTSPVPSGVTATGTKTAGVAPVADPGFSPASLTTWTSAQSAGVNVVLQPGIYASNPAGTSGCYFMAPGVYQFNGGINNAGTTMSNELKPPDEAAWGGAAPNYNSAVANPQFWSASGCAGSFTVTNPATALAVAAGSWGVVVTSTRNDSWNSVSYLRESVPSTCHSVSVSTGQGLQVTINNVPGAQGYNIYMDFVASGNACQSTPWGYVGHVNNTVTEVQGALGTTTSPIYDTSTIITLLVPTAITQACRPGTTYTFGCAAATGLFGAANPPGNGSETAPQFSGGPPYVPTRDIQADGGGDRANEHNCTPLGTNSAAPCAGSYVTPGAVQAYFPVGACVKQTQGVLSWFSGFQYNYIAVFAPSGNNCTVSISGHAAFGTGAVYWPAGDWSVGGNGGEPLSSQLIVHSLDVAGNGQVVINYDIQAAPTQGYSQISL